jgi:prolipoprotein diacylglyceryltransferase
VGRFFLEPLRENPETVLGRLRVNQVVAAMMAVGGAGTVLLRAWLR